MIISFTSILERNAHTYCEKGLRDEQSPGYNDQNSGGKCAKHVRIVEAETPQEYNSDDHEDTERLP